MKSVKYNMKTEITAMHMLSHRQKSLTESILSSQITINFTFPNYKS